MRIQESESRPGKNKHWLVCRRCLTGWPPDDVDLDNVHYEGDDDGPWERCDGELVELVLADERGNNAH